MDLHLTAEEETLAKDGQTPEEAFMSPIYLKMDKEVSSKYPEMKNSNVQRVVADVDENGTLVIPADAPEYMKDWIRQPDEP